MNNIFNYTYDMYLEMARPSILSLKLPFESKLAYDDTMKTLGTIMKYGKDEDGELILNSFFEPSYGCDPGQLQDRKLKYYYITLNKELNDMFNKLNPLKESYVEDLLKLTLVANKMAESVARNALKRTGKIQSKEGLRIAIVEYILKNPKRLKSSEFLNDISNTRRIADFIIGTMVATTNMAKNWSNRKEEKHQSPRWKINKDLTINAKEQGEQNRLEGIRNRFKQKNQNKESI